MLGRLVVPRSDMTRSLKTPLVRMYGNVFAICSAAAWLYAGIPACASFLT